MRLLFPTGWRRDLLIAVLASIVTGGILVPAGWASLQEQRERADARSVWRCKPYGLRNATPPRHARRHSGPCSTRQPTCWATSASWRKQRPRRCA